MINLNRSIRRLTFRQTMAATKRNSGLTSVIPRTMNDEELVSLFTFQ